MTRIALFGGTGSLGTHVARQAIAARHELSAFVRAPERLATDVAGRLHTETGDLATAPIDRLAGFIAGHDVLVSCAGVVTEGQRFCDLIERIVVATESLPTSQRPAVCWFMAGAGLLDIDSSGRRGVDLPKVRSTYWPHRVNFERLQRSGLGWRLLCPGPMVQGPAIGLERLRVSIDVLPEPIPEWTRRLPGALALPFFGSRIPNMIIPYADAAAFMLTHLDAAGPFTRKRVGLALPAGMKGKKDHWAAQPRQP